MEEDLRQLKIMIESFPGVLDNLTILATEVQGEADELVANVHRKEAQVAATLGEVQRALTVLRKKRKSK
jgi:t-SNARE complex subunit (syntaxin)